MVYKVIQQSKVVCCTKVIQPTEVIQCTKVYDIAG